MKKLIFIFVLIITSSSLFPQMHFGTAGTVGTKSGNYNEELNYGLHARFLNDFSDEIGFIGGVSYFLPTSRLVPVIGSMDASHVQVDMLYSALNGDLVIYLGSKESSKYYFLVGANYAFTSYSTVRHPKSESKLSWELGLGFKKGRFFIESKYDKNFGQIVAFIGFYI